MKRTLFYKFGFLVLVCIFINIQNLFSQDSLLVISSRHIAEAQVDRLTRELSLNGEQKKEIYNIVYERAQLITESKDERKLDGNRKNQINSDFLKKLKLILDDSQFNLLIQIRKKLNDQKRKANYKGEDNTQDIIYDIDVIQPDAQ